MTTGTKILIGAGVVVGGLIVTDLVTGGKVRELIGIGGGADDALDVIESVGEQALEAVSSAADGVESVVSTAI